MINVINTALCYGCKLLRKNKNSHHKENNSYCFHSVSIRDDGCLLNLLWSSFHDVGTQIIMLCIFNLSSAVCPLELNKTGRKITVN